MTRRRSFGTSQNLGIDREKSLASNDALEQDLRPCCGRARRDIRTVEKVLQNYAALLFMDKTIVSVHKPHVQNTCDLHKNHPSSRLWQDVPITSFFGFRPSLAVEIFEHNIVRQTMPLTSTKSERFAVQPWR